MRRHYATIAVLATLLPILAGCPGGFNIDFPNDGGVVVNPPGDDQSDYDAGFDAGFAMDDWYWDGYFDGYDTIDVTPIYYDATGIPYLESPPYDAGYWDGVWYAYNDGYFVDYHYAFVLGFSEGYDNAFWSDYLDFLANDVHYEFGHGGWIDGYDDGFSEGRVFGANDYEQGLPFDWLDALYDYEAGTDLYFEEVGVGTGVYGPVYLYQYGTDPLAKQLAERTARKQVIRSIRNAPALKDVNVDELDMFRALSSAAEAELQVQPDRSLRNDRSLRLDSTWLQRIDSYLGAKKNLTKSVPTQRARAR